MRKLEGVVKEIYDELEYLKKREERFTSTNSTFSPLHRFLFDIFNALHSLDEYPCSELCLVLHSLVGCPRCMADSAPAFLLQAQVSHRLGFELYLSSRFRSFTVLTST